MAQFIQDTVGAPWEKRGNSVWVKCDACPTWFPASPALLRPEAVPACCPACHHEFRLVAPGVPASAPQQTASPPSALGVLK